MTEKEPVLTASRDYCQCAATHSCYSDLTSSHRIAVMAIAPKILSCLKKAGSEILYLVYRNVCIPTCLCYFHLYYFHFTVLAI